MKNDFQYKELIEPLTTNHQQQLDWFMNNKGSILSWGDIPNRLLARSPKGIYCPEGKNYCLAIKNIIDSEYAGRESLVFEHVNGSFYFEYPPERNDKGMKYFTNARLLSSGNRFIPIGLLYQVNVKPSEYFIFGTGLSRYDRTRNIFQIYGFSKAGHARFLI